MTAPRFRSTAAFTQRSRRVAPAVDRATFVVFSVGGARFAAPVEVVERVLRAAPAPASASASASAARPGDNSATPQSVIHAKRTVPVLDIRGALGAATQVPSVEGPRVLIFSVQGVWVAAEVDAVYEVATLDASLVQPIPAARIDGSPWPSGARGLFTRHGQEVIVLDMARVFMRVMRG